MHHIFFEQKENEYLVKLEGRIDSNNSREVEQEIAQTIPKGKEIKVVMDFLNLEYISSAGLRVILKVKKDYQSVRVINVQPAVYDVFESTGFTAIIPITKVLREISIEGANRSDTE